MALRCGGHSLTPVSVARAADEAKSVASNAKENDQRARPSSALKILRL
jgi:hypothetical protein